MGQNESSAGSSSDDSSGGDVAARFVALANVRLKLTEQFRPPIAGGGDFSSATSPANSAHAPNSSPPPAASNSPGTSISDFMNGVTRVPAAPSLRTAAATAATAKPNGAPQSPPPASMAVLQAIPLTISSFINDSKTPTTTTYSIPASNDPITASHGGSGPPPPPSPTANPNAAAAAAKTVLPAISLSVVVPEPKQPAAAAAAANGTTATAVLRPRHHSIWDKIDEIGRYKIEAANTDLIHHFNAHFWRDESTAPGAVPPTGAAAAAAAASAGASKLNAVTDLPPGMLSVITQLIRCCSVTLFASDLDVLLLFCSLPITPYSQSAFSASSTAGARNQFEAIACWDWFAACCAVVSNDSIGAELRTRTAVRLGLLGGYAQFGWLQLVKELAIKQQPNAPAASVKNVKTKPVWARQIVSALRRYCQSGTTASGGGTASAGAPAPAPAAGAWPVPASAASAAAVAGICTALASVAPVVGQSIDYSDESRARFLSTCMEVDAVGALVDCLNYHLTQISATVSRDLLLSIVGAVTALIPDASAGGLAGANLDLWELRPKLVRRAGNAGIVHLLLLLLQRFTCAPEDTRLTIPDTRTGNLFISRKLDVLACVYELMELLLTGFSMNRTHNHEHDWLKASFVNSQAVSTILTVTSTFRQFLPPKNDAWKMKVLSGALRVVPSLLELEADSEQQPSASDSDSPAPEHYPGWFAQMLTVLSEALPTITSGLTAGATTTTTTVATADDATAATAAATATAVVPPVPTGTPPPAGVSVSSSVIFVTIASYYRNDTQNAVECGIFELVSAVTTDPTSDVVHMLEPLLVSLSRSPRGREALVQTSEKEVEDMELSIEVGGSAGGSGSFEDNEHSVLTHGTSSGSGGSGSRLRRTSSGARTTSAAKAAVVSAAAATAAGAGGGATPAPAPGRIVPVLDILMESIREYHNSRLDTVCPVLIALLKDPRFGGWLVHTYRNEFSAEHLAELARRTSLATTSFNRHVSSLRECVESLRAESQEL